MMAQEKNIDVCGIGNGLVDVVLEVSEAQFARLNIKPLSYELIDITVQQKLLATLHDASSVLISGGSVANSVVAVRQLGGRAGYITSLGDDEYGRHFKHEFAELGLAFGGTLSADRMTGTCASIVTPDAVRTMRVSLGAALDLVPDMVNEELIARSKWLFIEGYLFSNGESGQAAVLRAVEIAKEYKTKIALTCSDAFVLNGFGDALRPVAENADLIFANQDEAAVLAKVEDTKGAFEILRKRFPNLVVTAGPEGAFVSLDGKTAKVEAFKCVPQDLTGAGDMFAGTFLYALTHGASAAEAARMGCFMAKQVITRLGARLPSEGRDYRQEALQAAAA